MRLTVRFNSAPTAQEQMKRAAIKEKVTEAQIVKERPAVAEATIKTREFETSKAQTAKPPAKVRPQAAPASSQNKAAAPAIKRGAATGTTQARPPSTARYAAYPEALRESGYRHFKSIILRRQGCNGSSCRRRRYLYCGTDPRDIGQGMATTSVWNGAAAS